MIRLGDIDALTLSYVEHCIARLGACYSGALREPYRISATTSTIVASNAEANA
jgi:hypothetical protein